jgi:hypothetical protein
VPIDIGRNSTHLPMFSTHRSPVNSPVRLKLFPGQANSRQKVRNKSLAGGYSDIGEIEARSTLVRPMQRT